MVMEMMTNSYRYIVLAARKIRMKDLCKLGKKKSEMDSCKSRAEESWGLIKVRGREILYKMKILNTGSSTVAMLAVILNCQVCPPVCLSNLDGYILLTTPQRLLGGV